MKIIRQNLARIALGWMEPESARKLAVALLQISWPVQREIHRVRSWLGHRKKPAILNSNVFGIPFDSPLGIAAGLDKQARVFHTLAFHGVKTIELGTVTPKPQKKNSGKILVRIREANSAINRMGFNSVGIPKFKENLRRNSRRLGSTKIVIGVNLGLNRDAANDIEGYVEGALAFNDLADYIAINVSSPNTPGLRNLQAPEKILELVSLLKKQVQPAPKILIKVSPDFEGETSISELCAALIEAEVDGVIVSNTTIARPNAEGINYPKDFAGGLSGDLLFELSTETLRKFYKHLGPAIPIIGVGGVSCAETAFRKIKAGASLVHLYTALAYKGLGLVREIESELAKLLQDEGFSSVSEAVGADHRAAPENAGAVAPEIGELPKETKLVRPNKLAAARAA